MSNKNPAMGKVKTCFYVLRKGESMDFKCTVCGAEYMTKQTLYKCPECKCIQPTEDYEKAFNDVLGQYEEERSTAAKAISTVHMACETYKKERNIYIITTVTFLILTVVLLLR